MPALKRGYVLWVAAWICAGLLIAFFERPIHDALWVMDIPLFWTYILLGVITFVVGLVRIKHWGWVTLAPAITIPVAATALFFFGPRLSDLGDHMVGVWRFSRHKAQYEGIIAQVNAAPSREGFQNLGNVTYVVDKGPPVRVAFVQPGGIVDNWEGIVYDPTGVVSQARGWATKDGRPNFTATGEVRQLFGGDLVSCEHLQGDFYRCFFT